MALGDTIKIQLLQAVTGYGAKDAVLTLTETAQVEAMIANGLAVVYYGTAALPSLSATFWDPLKRDRQQTRQRTDRRAQLPLTTEPSAVAATTVDATLTKFYGCVTDAAALAAQTGGTYRVMSTAEVANSVIDLGLPLFQHVCYKSGGLGYHFACPSNDLAVWPALGNPVTLDEYRFRTNAPKVQIGAIYRWKGATENGHQVYVNGQPVTVRPAAGSSGLDYVTLTFPSPGTREISIKTTGMVWGVAVAPIYQVWRPEPRDTLTLYSMGDSYSQPTVWTDAGSANGLLEEGLPQLAEDHLGVGDHYIDSCGGSGWLTRITGAARGPNNNYEDRWATGPLRVKPDMVWIPNGANNDLSAVIAGTPGYTLQAIADAVRRCFLSLRVVSPQTKFVWADGYTAPGMAAGMAAQMVALRALLQAQLADIGVYYFATSGDLTGTGKATATNGTGNADWTVGSDNVHLTGAGYRAFKLAQVPKLRRVLLDDGTLINTVL